MWRAAGACRLERTDAAAGRSRRPPVQPLPRGSWPAPSASELPVDRRPAFDNMSGDRSVDSLVDGIVEEITATLSRMRDFTVIARNSAYAYKGRPVDVRTIARELGVRYVLEGSLRKAGDRVRVTAQLIDAMTGNHLWADRYDGVVENLFDFEDEIADAGRRCAAAVDPRCRDRAREAEAAGESRRLRPRR